MAVEWFRENLIASDRHLTLVAPFIAVDDDLLTCRAASLTNDVLNLSVVTTAISIVINHRRRRHFHNVPFLNGDVPVLSNLILLLRCFSADLIDRGLH